MNPNRSSLMTIVALLGSTQAAYAASTTTIYTSGWLVLAFFGFCALVVTVQLMPAIMMLVGMLKGLLSNREKETATQRSR